MNSTRVIAIGSPFGDDQIGFEVAKILQSKLSQAELDQFDIIMADRPGIYLIELMKQAQCIHLIDAVKSNKPIGTIHRITDLEMLSNKKLLSSHEFALSETLLLAKTLDQLPEKIIIHCIEVDAMENNNEISKELKPSCHELAKIIQQELIEGEAFVRS